MIKKIFIYIFLLFSFLSVSININIPAEVIESFDAPGYEPAGLAFDGKYLWVADLSEDKIYKLDISGNVIDSFDTPGNLPRDLAWDGQYLWVAYNAEEDSIIYKYDVSQ